MDESRGDYRERSTADSGDETTTGIHVATQGKANTKQSLKKGELP